MGETAADRVIALDLIRGVAVLGILAINIAVFAGPATAALSPHVPQPGTLADEIAYAIAFVLFEGKMRALFTLLFGASLLLFIERSEAAGRHGDLLQLRRLGWLALFGLAHFFLFWWGDILFLYAIAGILALFIRELPVRSLVTTALAIFVGWHLIGLAMNLPGVIAEERVRLGTATPVEQQAQADWNRDFAKRTTEQLALMREGFVAQARHNLTERTLAPLETAYLTMGETLPLMLIGMALFRTGFFSRGWPRERMRRLAWAAIGLGMAMTLTMLAWLWLRGFPGQAMTTALLYANAIPHLLMGFGYAALLVLASPRIAATAIGQRLVAAGRMAFSNYLGTTLLMTAIFNGWGLGQAGRHGPAAQWLFVALAWALMLGWSKWWLARYRRGPLEWLWRSLVESRILPNRR